LKWKGPANGAYHDGIAVAGLVHRNPCHGLREIEDNPTDVIHGVGVDLHGDLSGFEVETLGDQICNPDTDHPERHNRILVRLAPLCPLVDRDAIRTKRGGVVDRGDCDATTVFQPTGDDRDCFVGNRVDEVSFEVDGGCVVIGLLCLLVRARHASDVDQGVHFCLSNDEK